MLISVIAAIALLLYIALEWSEVITIETASKDGASRHTHVWYIQNGQSLLLEAGHPENPWVQELANRPTLHIIDPVLGGTYSYVRRNNPIDHTAIRMAMREKYGWRDAWVSLLFDTSQSSKLELSIIQRERK